MLYWRIAYRWAVLLGAVAGLFWGGWYLLVGEVPSGFHGWDFLAGEQLGNTHLSRWWDIPAIGLFGTAAWSARVIPDTKNDWAGGCLVATVLGGLFGLLAGILGGMSFGIVLWLFSTASLLGVGSTVFVIYWSVTTLASIITWIHRNKFNLVEYFWEGW